MKKYSGTYGLLAVSVFLQSLCTVWPGLTESLAFNANAGLWAVVGLLFHAVSHGSWDHLLGNYVFGMPYMLYLEHKLGTRRFLSFYAICALTSLGQHDWV